MKETQDLFQSSLHKGATSPLRCSQRAGLPYNPFPHSINHTKRLSCLLVDVHEGRGNTNFRSSTTKKWKLTGTSNRVGAKLQE
jgi:hypothetical protein